MSQGVYVLGGKCPGGKCPGGKCLGGICPWGKCPGGTCPGGYVLEPQSMIPPSYLDLTNVCTPFKHHTNLLGNNTIKAMTSQLPLLPYQQKTNSGETF